MIDENGVVFVAVRLQEDKVIVLKVNTRGRGDARNICGASQLENGWWIRQPTLAVLQREIDEAIPPILADESRGYKGPIVDWQIVNAMPDLARGWAFRSSWRFDGKEFAHHMPSAREGYRNALRRFRLKPMAELDVAYQRADEEGDVAKKRDVVARKQKLRDLTADPRIEAAQTIEELLAVKVE